ncbi:sterile alpha motif domain-containing protein 7 [Rhynchocyon petersi]
MTANPLLAITGQQKNPVGPSPFEPPVVNRDVLPSTVAPTDPRQFCLSSPYGSSVIPNTNLPTMLPNRVYSGWGILPPESVKAMARRNELIQRHNTARTEMEMYAIYQQRRTDKMNPKGLTGAGIPFLYGSSIPVGPTTYHGRSMLPANDVHLHRSTWRNLQGNPMLVASGSHFLESWEQKYRRLRRGPGNQKVLDSDTDSSKSQAEFKTLGQTQAILQEEDEFAKDPEAEALNSQKPRETSEKPTTAPADTCAELESTLRMPWAAHSTSLEAKAWDSGKEKTLEQSFAACNDKNQGPLTIPPGTCELVTAEGHLSLDEDIQKWTVDDVHNFISSLPGCSGYAQVFKDHAIDGETLPLLTEEHLRDTMGIKLGPALKIQSQVSQHMGSMFYKKSLSLPIHTYSTRQSFDQPANPSSPLDFNSWSDTSAVPCSQDTIPKGIEQDSMRN